jgi:hypothetical protein
MLRTIDGANRFASGTGIFFQQRTATAYWPRVRLDGRAASLVDLIYGAVPHGRSAKEGPPVELYPIKCDERAQRGNTAGPIGFWRAGIDLLATTSIRRRRRSLAPAIFRR